MEDVATKILPLVQLLMPGFITTMIFYWLADAKKPEQFERTIQALIGTGVISLLVAGMRIFLEFVGENWFSWGAWSQRSEQVSAAFLAVIIGLGLAYASNHDLLYKFARACRLTTRASNVEWIYAFRRYSDRYIILTFLDGRRLCGYPLVWPTDPKDGHFVITKPSWIDKNGKYVETDGLDSYIVSGSQIQLIEIAEAS